MYIKGWREGEKIGCANNTMSGVISEQADDKRQKEKNMSFYNLSKKPPSTNTKKLRYSKKDM